MSTHGCDGRTMVCNVLPSSNWTRTSASVIVN